MKGKIKPGAAHTLMKSYLKIYKNSLPKELKAWLDEIKQLEGEVKEVKIKNKRALVYYEHPEIKPDGTKIVGIDVPIEIVEIIEGD